MKENASVANSNNWVLRVLPCLELWPAVTLQSEKISHRRYTYWSKSLKHRWVSWFPVIWVSHDLKQVVTDVEKGIYTSLRSHLVGLLQVSNSFVAVHVASLRTWYRLPHSTLLACARTFHFTIRRWKWGITNEKCLLKFVEGLGFIQRSLHFNYSELNSKNKTRTTPGNITWNMYSKLFAVLYFPILIGSTAK